MAIQCKITTIQGVTLETAYINIQNPQIVKAKTEVITPIEDSTEVTTTIVNSYTLCGNACVYVDKASYDNGKIPMEGFAVTCDLNLDDNPLAQAYEALKLNERLENIEEC